MVKHIKVNSMSTAWEVAASIFPTDYQKDEESSKRAGYSIYKTTSTDESFSGFHISDLNTRLMSYKQKHPYLMQLVYIIKYSLKNWRK